MRKRYTHEEDQILLNMALNGSTNEQIAQAIHRTVRSVESRKATLRGNGMDMPRSPRQMSLRVDDPKEAVSAVEADYPETSFGEVDALELLQVEIDNLNHNEADLLVQLDVVRAEKFNISMKLNSLLEALKVMKTLEEDPS